MALVKCKKCAGKGNVGSYRQGLHGEFSYTIDNGTCWGCAGKGVIDTEAKATKEDMQSVFSSIYMEHIKGEQATPGIIKTFNKRLTRVIVNDAIKQMERMGLVKTVKQSKRTVVIPTEFGLERWRKRLERVKEEYPLELV